MASPIFFYDIASLLSLCVCLSVCLFVCLSVSNIKGMGTIPASRSWPDQYSYDMHFIGDNQLVLK